VILNHPLAGRTQRRPGPTPPDPPDLARELLLADQASRLSNAELVAVLAGRRGPAGAALAARLLVDDCLGRLIPSRAHELRGLGVSERGATTLLAAYELARRLAAHEIEKLPDPLTTPSKVAHYLRLHHMSVDQEILGALFLDVRRRPIASAEIYRGTLHRAAVEPRAILKDALLLGAASILLFHTHPSGDPTPSAEDGLFTERLLSACEIVGVELVDHLIVTFHGAWFSIHTRTRAGWPDASHPPLGREILPQPAAKPRLIAGVDRSEMHA
jgi:DNA repair protein RadC